MSAPGEGMRPPGGGLSCRFSGGAPLSPGPIFTAGRAVLSVNEPAGRTAPIMGPRPVGPRAGRRRGGPERRSAAGGFLPPRVVLE